MFYKVCVSMLKDLQFSMLTNFTIFNDIVTLTNFSKDFIMLTDFTTFKGRRADQTLQIILFGPPLKHKEVLASFDKFCTPIFFGG